MKMLRKPHNCGTCGEKIPDGEGREKAGLWFHDTWEDCQQAMSPSPVPAVRNYRRKAGWGKTRPHPTLDQVDDKERK